MLEHLRAHLSGKAVILGIGSTLRSDDGIGSILASRIQGKIPHIVYDASISLIINYLQNSLLADIIVLMIQPKVLNFGDKLSPELDKTLNILENWFLA